MRFALLMASVVALAACSSPDLPSDVAHGVQSARAPGHDTPLRSPIATRQPRAVASLPDNGSLVAYTRQTTVKQSAYTWHPVRISEAHALGAIATGTLTIEAPDGTPIRLKYDHHVEHPDGNWTWVGRPEGAQPGTEAVITFGEKAVFGTIPNRGRKPLRIGSSHGHAWVMETDEKRLQSLAANVFEHPDFAVPPALAGARDRAVSMAAAQPQQLTAAGAVPESATIDIVIGYTNTFASRLGSASAAVTRLTFLTDLTNQAFTNSQVVARLRLVGTIGLNYPDATDNQAALRELTGVTCTDLPDGSLDCTDAPIPAALQPLVNLRASKRADLVSLVRNFSEPENEGCGIAWMLGGGMEEDGISPAEVRYYGVSVVSDSNGNGDPSHGNPGPPYPDDGYVCRDETFAHEVGHNLGSQHDAETAQGDDGVLDDHDRGVFRYSMGYKSTSFFTIMAYGNSSLADQLVFSNPRITSCGAPCGVAEEADNARSIGQTAPILASAQQTLAGARPRWDLDGDGRSDLVWRNTQSGANTAWLSANSATPRAVTAVPNLAWAIAGAGDFNGDGTSDLLWRAAANGTNAIWYSGLSSNSVTLASTPSTWIVAGTGDFNGDGRADIFWRKPSTGANAIWLSGNAATQQAMATVNSPGWTVAGIGDFDGDGRDDVLWRNTLSGANTAWRSANAATGLAIATVANQDWQVAGIGDFDFDGRSDVLWRNADTAANVVWWSANAANTRTLSSVPSPWAVANVADYNGDGAADIFWRNTSTYASVIWRSGLSTTQQAVTTVANPAWSVAR